jgi:hypothetical protein
MQVASVAPAWYRTRVALYLTLLTLGTAAFFVVVWGSGQRDGPLNKSTELVFLILGGSGALIGLCQVRKAWHATSQTLHAFGLALCAGLLIDAVGNAAWLAYNVAGIPVPYPSLADVFYIASDLAWVIGLCLFFWVLDTNVRDELGPFIDILGATWSLTIVVLSLLGLSEQSTGNLLKLLLDIIYPFISALACALTGSIAFGPQLRRLSIPWRWFVLLLYFGWLLTFFGDIGFSVTTTLSQRNLDFSLLYYDGGPIDLVYAVSNVLLCWTVAFLPLGQALYAEKAEELPDFGLPAAEPRA